jgi:hypothetical protein
MLVPTIDIACKCCLPDSGITFSNPGRYQLEGCLTFNILPLLRFYQNKINIFITYRNGIEENSN